MKRIALVAIALAIVGAACGGDHAVSLGQLGGASPTPSSSARPRSSAPSASPAGRPTSASPAPSSSAAPTVDHGVVTYRVWFTHAGRLFESSRTQPFTQAVGTAALTAMLAGPSSLERSAGISTVIPTGTRLLGLTISSGVASVDVSGSFESSASGATMNLRVAQVVYTITQFSTVRSVRFAIEGTPRTTVGGMPVQDGQTRAMYAGDLPAILIEAPIVGQRVGTPVTVSGTADVFEATVTVRVLDASGHEIARTFTQASCGTGCRGTYSASLAYHVGSTQSGTVEVFDASAKDGSPENVVDIPVTLAA